MKTKYFLCIVMGILFIAMYAIGYNTALKWKTNVTAYKGEPAAKNAVAEDDVILKKQTRYVLETYDRETKETNVYKGNIPIEFIAYTRDELIEFIGSNQNYFAGENENVLNVMLIAFSDEQIVIRKTVEYEKETKSYNYMNEAEPKYYIFLIEDVVVVYKGDKTTVYMETGITADELSEENVSELKVGVAVKNVSELYRLLESYTS